MAARRTGTGSCSAARSLPGRFEAPPSLVARSLLPAPGSTAPRRLARTLLLSPGGATPLRLAHMSPARYCLILAARCEVPIPDLTGQRRGLAQTARRCDAVGVVTGRIDTPGE